MTGGVCGGGGACIASGMHGRGHGRRDGHCSGWYASYWNAFLLNNFFLKDVIKTYNLNKNAFQYV